MKKARRRKSFTRKRHPYRIAHISDLHVIDRSCFWPRLLDIILPAIGSVLGYAAVRLFIRLVWRSRGNPAILSMLLAQILYRAYPDALPFIQHLILILRGSNKEQIIAVLNDVKQKMESNKEKERIDHLLITGDITNGIVNF